MKIKGYKQLNGAWVSFERKVGLLEYVRHLYYGWWTIGNYYYRRLKHL